jgi:hypothetical protein
MIVQPVRVVGQQPLGVSRPLHFDLVKREAILVVIWLFLVPV